MKAKIIPESGFLSELERESLKPKSKKIVRPLDSKQKKDPFLQESGPFSQIDMKNHPNRLLSASLIASILPFTDSIAFSSGSPGLLLQEA